MKRLAAILLLTLVLVASLTAVGFAADSLVVQEVSTDGYPNVALNVIVPASLLQTGQGLEFAVSENGKPIKDVSFKEAPQDAQQTDVILLVDTSGSMKGDALASAKGAASAFIEDLKPGSRAALISFATRPNVSTTFIEDKAALKSAVAGLEASGETSMYDALQRAAELAATAGTSRPSIVLLSDGGDTKSRTTLDAAVKSLQGVGAPVFVVSLPSDEADPSALNSIASQTGGRLFTVESLDQLVGYYKGLARELQTQYIVSYKSRQPSTKDLDVVVSATSDGVSAEGAALTPNPLYLTAPKIGTGLLAVPAANLIAYAGAISLAFLAVGLLAAAVLMIVLRPRAKMDHLEYYDQLKGVSGELPEEDAADADSLTARVAGTLAEVAGKRGFTRLVYENLERAGLPLRPNEYMFAHFALVLVVGFLARLLFDNLLVAFVVIILATLAPIAWIRYRADSRRKQFEEQLPDVLALIAGSLRAGWGLQQSVELVTREMQPPVSDEFKRVETEVRLGMSLEDSLMGMAERVDSDDFRWAVSAIAIQREVGGNLAEVLDIIAKTIRDRASLRRQIRALTSEGRLSAYILIGLPIFEFLLLMVVNPRYMSLLFKTTPGLIMLFFGIVMLIVGSIWLRRATNVEV